MRGLYQALAVAAMCLQEQAATRPLIGDVVTALSYLASQTYDPNAPSSHSSRSIPNTPRSSHTGLSPGVRVQSPNPNSPDLRRRDSRVRRESEADTASGCGSGRKWGFDDVESQDSQWGSPAHMLARDRSRNTDRQRAIAEARVWGENWRERRHAGARGSSFDSTNE